MTWPSERGDIRPDVPTPVRRGLPRTVEAVEEHFWAGETPCACGSPSTCPATPPSQSFRPERGES